MSRFWLLPKMYGGPTRTTKVDFHYSFLTSDSIDFFRTSLAAGLFQLFVLRCGSLLNFFNFDLFKALWCGISVNFSAPILSTKEHAAVRHVVGLGGA